MVRRNRLVLCVALSLALVALKATADTYPRQLNIDALNYTFRVTLSDTTDEIVGEATVELRFLSAGATEFELDLINKTSGGKGMTVTAVSSESKPLRFKHENDRLRILLDSPSRAGEIVSYTVSYHGIPATGLNIGANQFGDRTFFTDDWPNKARNWLPTIDHPYDKATDEMQVTAPAHFQVISNGLLIEQTDLPKNMRRTVWKESVPISTWLYSLGVAPFAVQYLGEYDGIPLSTWVFPQERETGFKDFGTYSKPILTYFSEWIGPYSYEKLAHVHAAGLRGATELASTIFYEYRPEAFKAGRGRQTMAHETAHHWFGDAVTEKDWDDVWLSEGFATYFTLLYEEHAYGRDSFVAGLKRSREFIFNFASKQPDYTVIHNNLSDMSKVLSNQIYQKGGWTLHMLRGIVGDENFWTGIREYYRRYRNSNASTDDFRHVMEQASGQDLEWFFHEWLNRGGIFKVEGHWHYNAQAKQLEVQLNQEQPGELFRMPIQIGIVTAENQPLQIQTAEVKDRENTFAFPLEKEPVSVTLDPNTWVLMQSEFGKQ